MRIVFIILSLVFVTSVFGEETSYQRYRDNLAKATVRKAKLIKKARRRYKAHLGIDKAQIPKAMTGDLYTKHWELWQIARANLPALEAVAWNPPSPLKIISEIRLPRGEEQIANLAAEMAWARAEGYSGCLIVWRQGDDPAKLAALVAQLKSDGWWILLSIGPGESSESTSYIPIEQIKTMLAVVLPHCDAFLPGWRKSSPPHWTGDNAVYPTALAAIARNICPEIPLLGNIFVTQDQETIAGIPSGASAVVVQGAGYRQRRPAKVRALVDIKINLPLIALIMGPRPYYESFHKIEINKQEVWQAKHAVEKKFQGAGFGTITMAGDGADGRREMAYDDLGRTKLHETENEQEK